ncbi:MAG: RNA 2',3'-cyclic phosphodiesterase [Proteobacteria bacterium]|nr:RNA 2',3'-cyclic phosphodiesterase [Pseudomonadota bacterium]MBU1685771.1 RNA 2',3'-cyclic phosphodiesterase [Pseudomonadota bacterium]
MKLQRLFIALELSEAAQDALDSISVGLPGARWVGRRLRHLTMRFLGEVPVEISRAIGNGLATVKSPTFQLRMKGIGWFPPRGMPHVVWGGVEENDYLLLLKLNIDQALRQLGIAGESRSFFPHITIARLKGTPPGALEEYRDQNQAITIAPFEVAGFHLFSSVLSSRGAAHRIEKSFLLERPDS